MQRGSSGATFTFLGDRVVKKGDSDRVMEQGMWLMRHQSPAVPKVFQTYAKSYVMERLIAPPLWALDHQVILSHMVANLRVNVWSRPAEVCLDHTALVQKYHGLCDAFDMKATRDELDDMHGQIIWTELTTCLTHGDPTFENVMFREDEFSGSVVLADPVPATPAVPDLMSVDIGKILQSQLGWEEIRYDNHSFRFRAGTMGLRRNVVDHNEWRASAFWAAIHFLRTFPYVTDDVRRKLKGRINAAIRMGI